MRFSVIGDEDTVVGFRFAGVAGATVGTREEAGRARAAAVERGDTVLIIPERVADWVREDIDRIRFGTAFPLIVEVPGREGPISESPSLFRLIREAVGIKF